jgi:hypothetical protein
MALQCGETHIMIDVIVRLVLAVLVIVSEGVTCDVWIRTSGNAGECHTRRLRSVVDNAAE